MTRLSSIGLFVVLLGCSAPSGDERQPVLLPARETFPLTADVLESHCGSLDCHGSKARNMRIYGINGLRIDGVTGDGVTTADEYEATFQSVVTLEPEKLSAVVASGGVEPERLTLVRKARGTEDHKGGGQMPTQSAGDVCLTSWLAGAPDEAACTAAAEFERPVQ